MKVGDEITTGFIEHNPGRIAAQTAKQIVIQKLREAERELVLKEFSDKTGQILNEALLACNLKQISEGGFFVMIGKKKNKSTKITLHKDNPEEIIDFFNRWDFDTRQFFQEGREKQR